MDIGHTRTGYEQSRREHALLHEELADRERALRVLVFEVFKSWKTWREQEFRLEEFSIRKLVENHFKDVESVRSGKLFHVPSQPALFPLLREPGGSTKRLLRRLIEECSIPWIVFFYYGKHSGASKHEETRDRRWWSRQQPILSQVAKIPNSSSMFRSNFFDSWRDHRLEFQRSSRRSVFKELKSQKVSQGSAKRWKEKFGGKGSRGRTEPAVHLKTISTAVLAWMAIAQLHLLVIGEQSSQRPKWKLRKAEWLKFSGNGEYAWQLVKNASGRRAAEVFKETTEEYKVLKTNQACKIHESHTVTEKKGPSRGKIGPTEPRGVKGMYQNSRCASREKTWVQSTKMLNENWDAISLVFLSVVLRENFSSFRSTFHNFKPYYAFKRMELITLTKRW